MANFQKPLNLQFESLPNEIILEVLNNLDIKDLANCVTVSKRIRGICEAVKIFQKIILSYNWWVPKGFLQLILNSGKDYCTIGLKECVFVSPWLWNFISGQLKFNRILDQNTHSESICFYLLKQFDDLMSYI